MARGDLNSTQSTANARGNSANDTGKATESTILRVLTTKFGLSQDQVQKMQALTGARGRTSTGAYPLKAVARQDLGAFATVAAMQSKQLTSAPTMADFNALQADISSVFSLLAAVAKAIA